MRQRGRQLLLAAGTCLLVAVSFAIAAAPSASATQRIFITGYGGGSIVEGTVDASGTIASLPTIATGSAALEGAAVSPNGKLFYTVGRFDGTLYGYKLDAAGTPTPAPGTPPNFTAGGAYSVVVTPNGKYAFASSPSSSLIYGFKISADASVTPTAQGSVSAPGPNGLAINSTGKLLFSTNVTDSTSVFKVGANGSLTAAPGSPVPSGEYPFAVSISPDDRHLYVADINTPAFLHSYSIAKSGELTAAGPPVAVGGDGPFGSALSPDGRYLYVANYNSDTISGFATDSAGALTPLPGSVYPGPVQPAALAMTASGGSLFAVGGGGPTAVYDVGDDGVPTNKTTAAITNIGDFQSVALTPAQPPKAKLKAKKAKRAKAGKPVKLSAKKSTDDGDIVEYAWKFGDGKKTFTMGPKVSHTYKRKGTYEATVTLTDDDGCSTTYVSTGQAAYCNGSNQAKATKKLKVRNKVRK